MKTCRFFPKWQSRGILCLTIGVASVLCMGACEVATRAGAPGMTEPIQSDEWSPESSTLSGQGVPARGMEPRSAVGEAQTLRGPTEKVWASPMMSEDSAENELMLDDHTIDGDTSQDELGMSMDDHSIDSNPEDIAPGLQQQQDTEGLSESQRENLGLDESSGNDSQNSENTTPEEP